MGADDFSLARAYEKISFVILSRLKIIRIS